MNENKIVEFEGRVERCVWSSPDSDWAIYAMNVDTEKYPDVKKNKYDNVSISGELCDLSITQPYKIEAELEDGKYGPTYKVQKIVIQRPKTGEEVYSFLREIITEKQAAAMYQEYPDIIDIISSDDRSIKEVDLDKLPGIGPKTLNKIVDKITSNIVLFDLVAEFGGILSLTIIKKLYDEYSSIEQIRKKLRTEPYKCLTRISGIGFVKADLMLLELQKTKMINFGFDLRTSKQRCAAYIEYELNENQNNGNTRMDIMALRDNGIRKIPECMTEHFVSCLKDKDLYCDKETGSVALRITYDTEVRIANVISHANDNPRRWNIDWRKYQNAGKHSLTDEQIKALRCICENNIMILNGFGGSGKSATSAMIIRMLDENGRTYKLMAPTGRAAKVLADYTQKPASTIHRGLGYMPPEGWGYDRYNPINCDVLLIDEFSMTDIFLFSHVIEAIDFEKTKLIMVGDSAQLPSVGPGNLLYDFLESNIVPTVTLNKIFRYGEGGLMKVATDVRNMVPYLKDISEKCTTFGSNQDYTFIQEEAHRIPKVVVALYTKLLKEYAPEDILVLSSYNKGEWGTVEINNQLQKVANENYGCATNMVVGEITYYKDDIVIQTANNYKARVYLGTNTIADANDDNVECTFVPNGMIGKVIKIDLDNEIVIINFDGVDVYYDREEMKKVLLGYSISVHKSQGGNAKVIIFLTPPAHTFMLNSNIIYVALTRMKEKCYHIGNVKTVNIAVKKKENCSRLTFMQGLLKFETINNKFCIDNTD